MQSQRHNPLAEEYLPSDPYKNKVKRTKRSKTDQEDEQGYVDSKSSKKILEIGRELEEEDERENQKSAPKSANPAFDFESRIGEDDLDEHVTGQFDDDEEAWGEEEEEVEEVEIDADDLAAWNKFIPTDDNPIQWPGQETAPSGPGTDLAALILEKIAAHEGGAVGGEEGPREIMGGGAPEDAVELPAKVVEGELTTNQYRLTDALTNDSVQQSRSDPLPLQGRQASQALQDSPHNSSLGDPPRHHTSRELDTKLHVRRDPNLHLLETLQRPNLPQHRSASRRPVAHRRDTKVKRTPVQRLEESSLQAQRILQRYRLPHAHRVTLHPT